MPPPDGLLLLTGWLVGAANLPRLLPKAFNLFHREEARHLDVLLVALPYIATSLPPAAESSCSTAAWRSVLGFSLMRSGLAVYNLPSNRTAWSSSSQFGVGSAAKLGSIFAIIKSNQLG